MLRKIITVSLMLAVSNALADPEACVDAKILQFHMAEGIDSPIHHAVLSEWEEECGFVESEDDYTDMEYGEEGYDAEGNFIDNTPGSAFVGKPATLPEYDLTSMRSETGLEAITGSSNAIYYTSRENKLVIDNIVVNRGQCKVAELAQVKGRNGVLPFPLTLTYSDYAKIQISNDCNVLEVTADYNGITLTNRMERP